MLHPHRLKFPMPGGGGTRYQCGKYSVSIGTDGSIRVKHGDWLSKYSAAIYGNVWTIDVFSHRNASGHYDPVRNPNRIYPGETIYHMPTVWGALDESKFSDFTMTARPVSEIEKVRLTVEHFEIEHPNWGERCEMFFFLAKTGTEAAEIVEVLGWLSEAIGEYVSPAGLIAFLVHATIDINSSWETGVNATASRARAYGITAWVFDDPPPPLPQYLRPGFDRTFPPSSLPPFQRAWTQAVADAMRDLDEMVRKNQVQKEKCQLVFQELGSNDRNTLATQIMTELAHGLSGFERDAFWQPPPHYPAT